MDFRKRLLEAGIKDADYIGDGVYIANDGFQIWLYTSVESPFPNRIAIDPAVMMQLIKYNDKFIAATKMGVEIYPHLNIIKKE